MSAKRIQQLQQNQKSESKTLEQLCASRKKQNFEELKKWDQQRAQKMILHRQVCDQIDQNLQAKLKQSNDYVQVFIRFLSQSLQQKRLYQSSVVTDPAHKLSHNLIGKNVHMTTSRALNKLYNQTQNQQHRCLKKVLQQGISEIMDSLEEGNKDIMDIRTRMELAILEIQNCNMSTAEACEKLMNAYNKDRNTKPFKSQSDFLIAQQTFMVEAIMQMKSQKALGNQVVDYINYMQKFQLKKVQLIKRVLKKFMQNNTYNKEKYESLHVVLDKSTQSDYINIFYSIEDLVERQNLVRISNAMGRFDRYKVQRGTVLNFLKNLQVEPFDSRNLIMKQYKVFCKIEGELQQAIVFITVDGFLNISGGHDANLQQVKFDYSFRIDTSLNIKPEGDINLVITCKKKNVIHFINDRNQSCLELVFISQDMRDQFCEFAEKIPK